MQAFTVHQGLVAPMDRANVDTDAIIPKQYLKSIYKSGFGPYLFDDWRYLDAGDLSVPVTSRRPNPEFVLNDARHAGAQILLARENFGCGSSREHAVWALQNYGFEAVLSSRFADIFRNNSLKGGLLTVILPQEVIEELWDLIEGDPTMEITVDLEAREVRFAGKKASFELDDYTRWRLMEGLDDIGLTLRNAEAIARYEEKRPDFKVKTLPARS